MGKKRIITKDGDQAKEGVSDVGKARGRKHLEHGILYINATYNNTRLTLTDTKGNTVLTSSSGATGFTGAKKGTPFAAAKIGETIVAKARDMGLKEVDVVIKGVGAGREAAVRVFITQGIGILSIKDATPIPHNGPRPKKPRRV